MEARNVGDGERYRGRFDQYRFMFSIFCYPIQIVIPAPVELARQETNSTGAGIPKMGFINYHELPLP